MNSFSFCMNKNDFVSLLFLKDRFYEHRILDYRFFFFFQYFKHAAPLVFSVASPHFKFFLFSVVLDSLVMICIGVVFMFLVLQGLVFFFFSFSDMFIALFKFGSFCHYFLKNNFFDFACLSSPVTGSIRWLKVVLEHK